MATVELPSEDAADRDAIDSLMRALSDLKNEKQQWLEERQEWADERKALEARIILLTTLLTGHFSGKATTTEARLLHLPVDAGTTAEEAETKQQQRESRERDREQRKQQKNRKKGRSADGTPKSVNGGGRRPVNPALKTETIDILVPAAERFLADGTPLVTLRWDIKEQEHYIPACIVRLITRIEVLGTADTHEYVIRASVPLSIVLRSKYHDSLIIEMIVRKYMRGMPFYRILQDVRAMGSDLSDSTLSDLVRGFAEHFSPITQAIRTQVLSEQVGHIDETSLPTQDGGRYLWAILGGRQVFFHVGGRGGNELRLILGLTLKDPTPGEQARVTPATERVWKFAHMMADGYTVYDTVLKEAGITRMNCWAHGLRDFKPFAEDSVIGAILKAIGELYAVEHQAKRDVERRYLEGEEAIEIYTRLRATKAKPQLGVVHGMLVEKRDLYTKGSKQRNAIDFLLDHWPAFTAYAERGDLPIDNNDAERALKMIVVGRKNWMLIGSEDAAPYAADIYTIMESCRLSKVEPRAYLSHVSARLHANDIPPDQLTPRALATRFPLRE